MLTASLGRSPALLLKQGVTVLLVYEPLLFQNVIFAGERRLYPSLRRCYFSYVLEINDNSVI